MVNNSAGPNNIFRVIENILLEEIQNQANWYFVLIFIGNVGLNPLPRPLTISSLTHLSDNCETSAIEIKKVVDMVRSDMIAKSI